MNKKTSILTLVALAASLSLASFAEARIGGGRSSGSRGFRGFAPRTSQTTSNFGSQQQGQPSAFGQNRPMGAQPLGAGLGGGGFMRNMMGGIAGGFLGSMLFRSFGHAGTGTPGGGGFGIFEVIVFAALGFFLFRIFAVRRAQAAMGANQAHSGFRPELAASAVAQPESEESMSGVLQRYDTSFDLRSFKEERMDDFFKFQAAWGMRDLSPMQKQLAPELRQTLETDLTDLKNAGRINRVENIAVRGSELVEAWQEQGNEFATVRFNANVVDYTVEENTNTVVEGDRTRPVKFEEQWTFVRTAGESSENNPWKLSAIH